MENLSALCSLVVLRVFPPLVWQGGRPWLQRGAELGAKLPQRMMEQEGQAERAPIPEENQGKKCRQYVCGVVVVRDTWRKRRENSRGGKLSRL